MIKKAKNRGYTSDGQLLNAYVEDAKKKGAPLKRTPSFNAEVAAKVRKD